MRDGLRMGGGRLGSWLGLVAGAATLLRAAVRRGRSIDLAGRTVIVTGGARGLGLLLAARAGAEGANVAICGRDLAAVAEARELLEKRGVQVLARACDLADRAAADAFVDEVARTFGGIDVVINNAGAIQVGPLETVTVDKMGDALGANLWSAVHVTLRALPHLRAKGREGRIVNVTSIGGRAAVPHLLPYGTAKFALLGFSESLRAELDALPDAPRVVTVIPGLMRTGSFYNAEFDGRRQEEFAWFSVASSLPILSIDANVAARRILHATKDGRAFLRLAFSGFAADLAHRLSPRLTVWAMGLAARALPDRDGEPAGLLAKGRHIASTLPGTRWLALGDAAARENNESPPRPALVPALRSG